MSLSWLLYLPLAIRPLAYFGRSAPQQFLGALQALFQPLLKSGVALPAFDVLGNCRADNVRDWTLLNRGYCLKGLSLFSEQADRHRFSRFHVDRVLQVDGGCQAPWSHGILVS